MKTNNQSDHAIGLFSLLLFCERQFYEMPKGNGGKERTGKGFRWYYEKLGRDSDLGRDGNYHKLPQAKMWVSLCLMKHVYFLSFFAWKQSRRNKVSQQIILWMVGHLIEIAVPWFLWALQNYPTSWKYFYFEKKKNKKILWRLLIYCFLVAFQTWMIARLSHTTAMLTHSALSCWIALDADVSLVIRGAESLVRTSTNVMLSRILALISARQSVQTQRVRIAVIAQLATAEWILALCVRILTNARRDLTNVIPRLTATIQ